MSPSWTTYSLPSMRSLPAALMPGLAAVLLEVGERVDLRADEALLEVGVDHAGGLGAGRALADRPRADLLLAGREVRLQAEQAVALARERRERRLLEAVRREQLAAIGFADLGELGLDLAAQDDDAGAFLLRALLDRGRSTCCRRAGRASPTLQQ